MYEKDWFEYEDELAEKYDQILNSNLSILRIWISLFGEDIIIKSRANNIFYGDCCFHYAGDIPVCINDNNKGFFCYSCDRGGTIITLIADYFNIEMKLALNILYAYILQMKKEGEDTTDIVAEMKDLGNKIDEGMAKYNELDKKIFDYLAGLTNTPR